MIFFEKIQLIFDIQNWPWKYNYFIDRFFKKQFPLSILILGPKILLFMTPTLLKFHNRTDITVYTAVWHQKQACYYDWALAFGLKATKCGIRIDRRTLYNLTRNLFIDTYMKVQPYFNVSLACTLRKLLASAFKLSEFSVKMISVKVWTFWEAHKNLHTFPHALYIYLINVQTMRKIFFKFCVPFRKSKL